MSGAAAFGEARGRLAAGARWKATLEALLLALDEDEAERLQQVMREGRGSWLSLLRASGGRALFLGDPLSGTPIALARAGYDVVVVAEDALGLDLARARSRADVEAPAPELRVPPVRGRVRVVRGSHAAPPVARGAFDLAVVEGDPRPGPTAAALRAARGEVALIAPNRLAYKHWSGRRGAFRVRRPRELVLAALDARRPEATLAGYRRRLAHDGVVETRGFALYPHALDFALIAALDRGLKGGGPRLFVGPKERENVPKMIAYRLGALPLATPSFCVLAGKATGPARIERVVAALAERIGEPRPVIEEWIASRGNTTVLQTRSARRGEPDDAGRWTIHIPHQPYQERQARRHFARIGELRERFPGFPAPEPLFGAELEGLPVFCERRVDGLTAPQAVGRTDLLARTYADTGRALARLIVERDAVLDEARFEELVGAKIALVRRYAAVPSTERRLDEMRARAAERLIGARLPLVTYHADLRSKHVVIGPEGEVRGLLDWGSSEACDLPYFDLLHLIVHERKQEAGSSAGEAWRLLGDDAKRGGLRPPERDALDDYAARVGLAPEVRGALEELYPVLVAAMAEKNWDYSRPRWLHRSFGL